MNKDVIYIDTEDDITTIIGKVKSSKERIIALVPPRRIGVLQSAVNIRLLSRAATAAKKRIVIVTNDAVLSGLAATAKIPVAKTLQSKPEIAEVPVLKVDDNDIIDGGSLPVGDIAKAAEKKAKADDEVVDKVLAENAIDEAKDSKNGLKKKLPKVPDFNIFRKKFLLIGGGVILLVVFLVWAVVFAPHAKVIISAKTTSVTVSQTVTLSTDSTTDAARNVVKAIKKEMNKEVSIEFAATGKKNVGEKATGSVKFSNLSDENITIAAGTTLKSSGGLSYTLAASVTVPRSRVCSGSVCYGTATGSITAAEGGAQYNAASGEMAISVKDISATMQSPTGGGTDKTATVLTQEDVNAAKGKLNEEKADGLKEQLMKTFGDSAKVVDESYGEKRSDPSASVSVGAEVSGNVKLKSTVTASTLAVESSELKTFIEAKIKDEIAEKKSQKIYEDGANKANFSQFTKSGATSMVKVTANGAVGPEIREDDVKNQAKGQNYGDVQSAIEAIQGVDDVDVKFSPFWVKSVPNDVNKISVEFRLNHAK